jgi:hypothetical protein
LLIPDFDGDELVPAKSEADAIHKHRATLLLHDVTLAILTMNEILQLTSSRPLREINVTPRSSPQLWSRRGVSPGSPKSLLRSKYLDHHGAYPGLGCAAR